VTDVAVQVLVLDAHIGEMHLIVVVRQVVIAGPVLDFLAAPIRPPVTLSVALIAFLEEALIVAFELAVKLHSDDAGVLVPKTFRLLQVGAIELRIVRPFPCPVSTRVEGLAVVWIAVSPMHLEETAASVGEHGGAVPAVERHALDESLLLETPQVVSVVERGIPWVAQVALWHDPKCPDRGQRPSVGSTERILAITVLNEFALAAIRQVQVAHEDAARVEAGTVVVAITSVAIAFLSPILITVAWLVLHSVVTSLSGSRPASQDKPLVFAVVNTVLAIT
jgi:hypothetical protein